MKINLNGKVRITDPCYVIDEWCGMTAELLAGTYECTARSAENGRIRSIKLTHIDYVGKDIVMDYEGDVCVDSGQMGVFDYDYLAGIKKDNKAEKKWYKNVCDITLGNEYGTTDDKGFVSSSGWGDGVYPVYAGYNENDDIVSLEIIFIER